MARSFSALMLFESTLYIIGIGNRRAFIENGKSLSKDDVLGRIGGEEFACLLANCDKPPAVQLAEQIRVKFSQLSIPEPEMPSVSIGVVTTRESDYDLSHLLSTADKALYNAKDKGRNRVTVFTNCAALTV